MNVSAADRFTVEDAVGLYGLDGWGNGYLAVGDDGHLLVTPFRDRRRKIDVHHVVEEVGRRGLRTPLMLRFPQLLEAQVEELCGTFLRAIEEFKYPERYFPVFPMKVNQSRPVIDGLLASGRHHALGLEVGSRPELLAATALPTPPGSLVICNGFKDEDYLSTAALAARLGKKVIVVMEKPFEVEEYLKLADRERSLPRIGFRIRLRSKGSGLWEKSGGFASKFGLTTLQLLRALERIASAGLEDRIALLHFHIGSQVTEVRKIKNAVREAARVYAKVHKRGAKIQYLDVGGGLGVDYDGSKTSSDASVNYTVQEYANDIVFGISEICEEERVPVPRIVSESGRMLTAYHALLVTDVRETISPFVSDPPEISGGEPPVVQDLAEVSKSISVKNYREYYHDALAYRDQLYSLFNLGMLSLEDRAKGETLFWETAKKAVCYSKSRKFVADEFVELEHHQHDKYVCNFSVFQSLPDHWALDHLFPVVPVHRLNERPTRRAALVDITCDSDGEVDKFVDLHDIKDALEVHEVRPGEPYYLAFALVGAYQDTMGDMHNLFGCVNEADVVLDPGGEAVIRNMRHGDSAKESLQCFGYPAEELTENLAVALTEKTDEGEMTAEEAASLLEDFRQRLGHYTYLD